MRSDDLGIAVVDEEPRAGRPLIY
uniref:Glycerol kinase-like n=1 Tax=Rhizophora mucronata TaxID=61149 RepID=A0A2P2IPK2_RHIMU